MLSSSCRRSPASPSFLWTWVLLGLLGGYLPAAAQSNVAPADAIADALRLIERQPEWQLYRGGGRSMAPRFDERHLLIVKAAHAEQLRPGMVALFHDAAGELVAHTVVDSDGTSIGSQGLNNAGPDPERIPASAIVGVLIGTLATNAAIPESSGLPVAVGKAY